MGANIFGPEVSERQDDRSLLHIRLLIVNSGMDIYLHSSLELEIAGHTVGKTSGENARFSACPMFD